MSLLLSWIMVSLLYFCAGAFREAAVVTYYKLIARNKRYSVSALAGGIEAYDLIVLAAIIKSEWNVALMISYVVGVTVGTFMGMNRGQK